MRLFCLLFLMALLFPAGASAAMPLPTAPPAPTEEAPTAKTPESPRPAELSPKDRNDVARISAYLNGLRSISAGFLQVDDQGRFMHGKIAIQRPGRMRVTYDSPNKDFIVADGSSLHIWDDELKSQTNIDQRSSLAEFILRDPVRLEDDVIITRFQRFPSKLELTLVETNDPAAGQLTLIFEDNPLLLRQWRVTDALGHTTGVNLENTQQNVTFPPGTFDFMPPTFGKGGKARVR